MVNASIPLPTNKTPVNMLSTVATVGKIRKSFVTSLDLLPVSSFHKKTLAQPSLQHGVQNGGPTSCECHELFSSQNALRKDKYGQLLLFLITKNVCSVASMQR